MSCNVTPQRIHSSSGYTLIELSMVLLILGLFVSGGLGIFSLYKAQQEVLETEEEFSQIIKALENFRVKFGRYPCPADMFIDKQQAGYGLETQCENVKDFSSTCQNGVCKVSSERRLDEIPFPLSNEERKKIKRDAHVLIGHVPAISLGLGKEHVEDGFNTPYTYAVTADLAIQDPNSFGLGAIKIIDINGDSVLKERGHAAFVVISHGRDKSVDISRPEISCTYNKNRNEIVAQDENCDLDATFRLSNFSTANTWDRYDDYIFYTYSHARPNWQPLYNSKGDMIKKFADTKTITVGSYKIGEDLSKPEPDDKQDYANINADLNFPKLEIHGNLSSQQTISQDICNDQTQACFNHNLLTSLGMFCPPNQAMVGIKDGNPICKLSVDCGKGLFITDLKKTFSYDDCKHLDTKCPKTDIKYQGYDITLPAINYFHVYIFKLGYNHEAKFACMKDVWEFKSGEGELECKNSKTQKQTQCDNPLLTGYKLEEVVTKCSSKTKAESYATRVLENSCKCEEKTETQTVSCSPGYIGELTKQRKLECPKAIWGSWKINNDNCVKTYEAAN